MSLRAFFAMSCICLPLAGAAQDVSDVSLLPGWQEADGTRMVGLRIRLAPGWHTYWRQPMGNGIPPVFDFGGSHNVASAHVHWPAPQVIESYGSVSAGYTTEVIFPVEIIPQQAHADIQLDVELFYGVCEEVCIPAEAALSLDIPASVVGGRDAVRTALRTATIPAQAAGITAHACQIAPDGEGFALELRAGTDRRLDTPRMVVFESGSDLVWIRPEGWRVGDSALTIDAQLSYYGSGSFALDRSAMRITLLGGARAIELTGCPSG